MRLHEAAHYSTASPLSSVLVVLWLLKSLITIRGRCPCSNAGNTNFSFGGLYTECNTTPGISIEICSTWRSVSLLERQTVTVLSLAHI